MVGFGKFLRKVSDRHSVAAESLDYDCLKKILIRKPTPPLLEKDRAAGFTQKLEEEITRVQKVVNRKLKALSRVRQVLESAREFRRYSFAQEHGIVLTQLSNAYDDVILVLWFMYLNGIAVSKIVKKYNKNLPNHKYIVDPLRWTFLSAGLGYAQKAKAAVEGEYSALIDAAPNSHEQLSNRNQSISEFTKGMRELIDEYSHHLYRSNDPSAWAVEPSLSEAKLKKPTKQVNGGKVHSFWGSTKVIVSDPRLLRNYQFGGMVGRGAYGIVSKAVRKDSGTIVAVKTIHDTWSHQILGQRTYREIQILQQLRHPNIVALNDVFIDKNKKDVHLVMPFVTYTCEDLLVQRKLDIEHKKIFMIELLSALAYIHARGVVHRDLKPTNLLVDESPRCYLSDFGLARTLSDGTETSLADTPDYVQTQWYRAPEVLLCSKKTTSASDMWSTGCILAELLTGVPLFPGQDDQHQVELILGCQNLTGTEEIIQETGFKIPASMAEHQIPSNGNGAISRESNSVAKFSKNTSYLLPRRTLSDMLDVCWKSGIQPDFERDSAVNLLQQLIQFEPSSRIDAQQAMFHPWFKEHPEVPDDVIEMLIMESKPACGEVEIQLDLSCTTLHSTEDYQDGIWEGPTFYKKRRETELNIDRHESAAIIQRFFKWKYRNGSKPIPRPHRGRSASKRVHQRRSRASEGLRLRGGTTTVPLRSNTRCDIKSYKPVESNCMDVGCGSACIIQ